MKKIYVFIIGLLVLLTSVLTIYYFEFLYSPFQKETLTDTKNLYAFDIFSKGENVISTKIDGKYLYYISYENEETENTDINYKIVKFNLYKNKEENEYKFNANSVYDANIIFDGSKIIIISKLTGYKLTLNKELKFIDEIKNNSNEENSNKLFGLYDSKKLYTTSNEIYVDDKLYDEVSKECGNASDIYYKKDTYIYYTNTDTNLSCLYNINNKKTTHLLSNEIELYNNGFIYSIFNTSKIVKYSNGYEDELYLNADYNNYTINDAGNLLFSVNDTSHLKIYDIENRKINYELELNNIDDYSYVSELNINSYAYYLESIDDKLVYYVWDYKKDNNVNKDMVKINKVDYEFENMTLIDELDNEYNINVYAYESSVRYFNDFYALPSTDDILINNKLKELKELLSNYTKEMFTQFKYNKNEGIKIYLTNKVAPSDLTTQISDPAAYSNKIDNDYIIAINITLDSFKTNICHEMMHTIENNMNDLFYDNKISKFPFSNWDDYNPKGFIYDYSYVKEENNKYTIDGKDEVYFVDAYSHTYPTEDMARIFENLCSDSKDNILLKYPNLKKKAIYIKNEIIKVYPSMKDSKLFDILK